MEINKTGTIVVTGGAGYIGSHTIIELLQTTSFKVVSIDNYSNSSEDTYNRIKQITGQEIEYSNIDLCNFEETLKRLKSEHELIGIIHFAAFKSVSESVENPHKYYHNNINSLLNVLECCLKLNVKNFIFSSSCSVYGNITELPVKESTPFNKAESPYAYTKQVGEEIIKDYCKAFPTLNAISLRYFNPVGAHLSGLNGELPINKPSNLVPVITRTAIGAIQQMEVFGNDYKTRDGSCIRDYIHVTDIAIAHLKALNYILDKKQKTNYSIFNLGSGNGISVFEAISSFEKVSGIKPNYKISPRRPGDVEAIYSQTDLSRKELDWVAQYTLDQMMESAWKWEKNLMKR